MIGGIQRVSIIVVTKIAYQVTYNNEQSVCAYCAMCSSKHFSYPPTYQVGIGTAFITLVKTLGQSEVRKLDPATQQVINGSKIGTQTHGLKDLHLLPHCTLPRSLISRCADREMWHNTECTLHKVLTQSQLPTKSFCHLLSIQKR